MPEISHHATKEYRDRMARLDKVRLQAELLVKLNHTGIIKEDGGKNSEEERLNNIKAARSYYTD